MVKKAKLSHYMFLQLNFKMFQVISQEPQNPAMETEPKFLPHSNSCDKHHSLFVEIEKSKLWVRKYLLYKIPRYPATKKSDRVRTIANAQITH